MAIIPKKLQIGDNFKSATYRTVNSIIDYLHTQRISGDNNTIIVNQQSAGITLSVKPNYKRSAESKIAFPFELSLITEDQNTKLSVNTGYINVSNTAPLIFNYKQFENALTLPTDSGKFQVVGYIQYKDNWQGGIFYLPDGASLIQMCGFHTFLIGKIQIAAEGAIITEQILYSNLSIDDGDVLKPFMQHYFFNESQHGKTLANNYSPDKVKINKGTLYTERNNFTLAELTENYSGSHCHTYIQYSPQENKAQIIYETNGSYPGYFENDKINIILVTNGRQNICEDVVFERFNYKKVSGYSKSTENLYLGLDNGELKYLQISGGTTTDNKISIVSENISVTENKTSGNQKFTLKLIDNSGMFTITDGFIKNKLDKGFVISNGNDKTFAVSKGEGLVSMNTDNTLSYLPKSDNSEDDYLGGDFTWKKAGKVKVAQNDILDYLPSKFSSSDTSIAIETINNKIDLKSSGKVKIDESDTTANYLENKLDIADAVSNIFSFETQSSGNKTLKLTSALNGYGVIVVQQGKLKFLQVSDFSKSYALTCDKGIFKWTQISDCEGE